MKMIEYKKPTIEVIEINKDDIVRTSNGNELPLIPFEDQKLLKP